MTRVAFGIFAGLLVCCTRSASGGKPKYYYAEHKADPVVGRLKTDLQPLMEKHLEKPLAVTMEELKKGHIYPAQFKSPIMTKAFKDPWGGMADAEEYGRQAARRAQGGVDALPDLLVDLAEPFVPGTKVEGISPAKEPLEDYAGYFIDQFDKAKKSQDAAFARLTADEHKKLFDHAPDVAHNFGPQHFFNDKTKEILAKDLEFMTKMKDRVEWTDFIQSAARLANLGGLTDLKKTLEGAKPINKAVPGVKGDILFAKETPHGWVIFGGKGDNIYNLEKPVALIVDAGGNDTYQGVVASSTDVDHANGVVIDLAGDDTYDCKEFGLACGRLGVGLLIDHEGKDTYKLAPGSGGVGLGGFGILCDVKGDDTYTGSMWTQGVGFGGIGLLYDIAGDDKYTSHGFALGFGGPVGVGAVIDAAGDDEYHCGHKIPSGYNESDAPGAKPDDPKFQWDAFGMGMGMGRRVLSREPEENKHGLAGGIGMVIDLTGKDKYRSSNFTQGCGYFFGIGMKLDFDGDDVHESARYGHASGAHYAMGLFIDYAGNDKYLSTGPTYNCGCAWDHSLFLCIDAAGDDTYDFERSAGLGRADIGSWGVFADLDGKDIYKSGGMPGRGSEKSVCALLRQGGDR